MMPTHHAHRGRGRRRLSDCSPLKPSGFCFLRGNCHDIRCRCRLRRGGLTTFSTFSAEVVNLLTRGEYRWGLAAASTHLGGSLALTATGMALANLANLARAPT
jgi:hypothetical protein